MHCGMHRQLAACREIRPAGLVRVVREAPGTRRCSHRRRPDQGGRDSQECSTQECSEGRRGDERWGDAAVSVFAGERNAQEVELGGKEFDPKRFVVPAA